MRVYEDPNRIRKKLVIVGDGTCGKTSLLMVQAGQAFPEQYVPTIFENYITKISLPNNASKSVELSLWDTAGQEDYDRLRPLSYPDTDVAVIAFAISNPDSFDNIREKWDPETKHFLPNVPRILVGCKADLRDNPDIVNELRQKGSKPVTAEQGVQMMHAIGASKYFECSAKTGQGISEIFVAAAKLALKQRTKISKCRLV
ncbi:P-loop containing nucleoside triphosphate hydrolase protein [Entophlyctis helioformis]|nr:P-loop containing nucleoside triphosphate hydrolase protein [Entophlyctis helioformis]